MSKSDYKPTALWHRKHCIGEFWVRCGSWPRAAVGSYLLLLDTMFQQGPMSRAEVDAILAPNTDTERALVLARFIEADGGLTHPRAHRERNEALSISQKRAKSGRRGGTAPKHGRKSLTNQVVESGSKVEAIAKQLPSKSTNTTTPTSSLTSEVSASLTDNQNYRIKINTSTWRFEGLCESDIADWQRTYPLVNIEREIARCEAWVKADWPKSRRRSWSRTINTWMKSEQGYAERSAGTGNKRGFSTRIETYDDRRARKDEEFTRNLDAAMARIEGAERTPPRSSTGLNGVAGHPSHGTQQKAS